MRRNRKARTPFGGMTLKMDIDDETKRKLRAEEKVPAWINDVDGRIASAQKGDYDFISAKEVGAEAVDRSDAISMRVGTTKHGEPINAYLMAIPKEYHDEDKAMLEEKNKAVDHAIRGGETAGSPDVDRNMGSTAVKKVDYKP